MRADLIDPIEIVLFIFCDRCKELLRIAVTIRGKKTLLGFLLKTVLVIGAALFIAFLIRTHVG